MKKRSHQSKQRPVVYISVLRRRFWLTRIARNGRRTLHPQTYANTQAAHRACRTFYPGVRVERVAVLNPDDRL